MPGRAVIGDAATVRAARPLYAFGSFFDQGEIPGGIAVRDGRVMDFANNKPHARTMAGVSRDGRILILIVADGYNPGVSVGFTPREAAEVLRAAGAHDGIFLDGGGSSILVGRDDDGEPAVFNRPAGLLNIPGTLRYVAVNLGFTNLRRTEEPLPVREDWKAPFYVVAFAVVVTWARVYPARATLVGVSLLAVTLFLIVAWLRRRRLRAPRGEAAPADRFSPSG
jgi:hypothetical protein